MPAFHLIAIISRPINTQDGYNNYGSSQAVQGDLLINRLTTASSIIRAVQDLHGNPKRGGFAMRDYEAIDYEVSICIYY